MWGNIIKKSKCHILGIGLELACNGGSCGGISLKRVKCHILGIGLELACNGGSCGGISLKRLKCHSRYWTGTSLQWRLMRGNIIKKR